MGWVIRLKKIKLEGSDIWKMCPQPDYEKHNKHKEELQKAIEDAKRYIEDNLNNLACFYEDEDELNICSWSVVADCIDSARLKDYIGFMNGERLYLKDGSDNIVILHH